MLKYFSRGNLVYLGDPALRGDKAKLICTASSNRLAGKIASFLNSDTRKGRAHEYFAYGTGNPKRAQV